MTTPDPLCAGVIPFNQTARASMLGTPVDEPHLETSQHNGEHVHSEGQFV